MRSSHVPFFGIALFSCVLRKPLSNFLRSRFTFIIMTEQQFPVVGEDYSDHQSRDLEAHIYHVSPDMIRFEDFMDDEASLRILREARIFCHKLSMAAKDNSLSMPGEEGIHSRNGWLLQRLLTKAPPGTFRPPLTDCCRFATEIFLFFGFENHFPDPTLVINTLLHKLKDSLGSVIPCSEKENVIVLWLLAVGAAAAAKLPAERDWFVSYMIDTAADMGLNSWDKMKKSMRRVIWIDGMNDAPFRRPWEDAMLIAQSQTTQDPFYAIHRLA
jgi:hypothetical protein